jgi:glycosyltransferase involved in cell wall biosynthesis
MGEDPNNSIIKVAVLIPSAQVGGAERIILEELSFLSSDPRFYFELHSVFEEGPLDEKFKELGIPVRVWNAPHKSPRMLLTYLIIARYLRRECFNVLHTHLLYDLGPWVGRLAGLKNITTVHNDVYYSFLERFCLRQSDLLFTCGAQVMRNLSTFISAKKLRLLNNAIRQVSASGSKREDILNKIGLCKDDKIVLTLGRLTEQKGYDLLVEAFKKVVEKEPKAVLLIGGDGPDRRKLEQQIIEAGMIQHIRLIGLVDNVGDLFMVCDAYVNSSRWEGLPVTILEAMAHKKPIVATHVGGNYEVIKNGETGLLVTPERPDLLAEGLLKLLGDKFLAAQFAEKGYELFKKDYSIEKHCAILASEYLA